MRNLALRLQGCTVTRFPCHVLAPSLSEEPAQGLRLATFSCDVTPPLGQPMFKGDAWAR